MLSIKQVKENIAKGIKMRIEDIPFGVSVPGELVISDYDWQVIRDQYEDYRVTHEQ